ncbi:CG1750, partial [Drosophila busckii]
MLHFSLLFNFFFRRKRKLLQHVCTNSMRCYAIKQSTAPKVLFFGTDNFSLPSLQMLQKQNLEIGVVTSFKSPANCVRSYAEHQRLPLYRWPVTVEQCLTYDLGVVVSFGHMIPSYLISAFPSGMINAHASLLPRWRGAAPIIYAIMEGDTKTGVSIMQIHPHHFDVGPLLAQREFSIKPDVYMPELHTALSHLGADLLVDTIKNLSEKLLNAQPQDDKIATYAPKISPHIAEIIWSKHSATELYARHRALYGFKSLTTRFLDKQVQVLDVKLPERPLCLSMEPGCFSYQRIRKALIIGCAKDSQLEVSRIRMEGKRPMSAQDFSNGFFKRTHMLQFTENKKVAC